MEQGRRGYKFFFLNVGFRVIKRRLYQKSEAITNIASSDKRIYFPNEAANPNGRGRGMFQKIALDLLSKELPRTTL